VGACLQYRLHHASSSPIDQREALRISANIASKSGDLSSGSLTVRRSQADT
jgi:hypothetical protein